MCISKESWKRAAKVLTPAAFKLYLYLAENDDGHVLGPSQRVVENEIGISKNSYYSAFSELIEKGYITKETGGLYRFSANYDGHGRIV